MTPRQLVLFWLITIGISLPFIIQLAIVHGWLRVGVLYATALLLIAAIVKYHKGIP